MDKAEIYNLIGNKMIPGMLSAKPVFGETAPISIITFDKWEWTQGVGLYALWQYYKLTGSETVFPIIVKWFDARLKEGLPSKNINTMCPMLTMAYLYEETRDKKFLPYLHEWAEAAMRELPRTTEGGLQHIVSGEQNPGQLWDDTLYMTVLFMAKYGALFDKKEFIEESEYQFMLHIKYLTDRKTGLWFHGWSFHRGDHFAGALWARGNSWFTAGVMDYLEIVSLPGSLERFLLSAYREQVGALKKYQHSSGLWHTLIDDGNSYLEVSASANFAYGILKGVRKGFLDKSYLKTAEKAVLAIYGQIDENGMVRQVSYGTGMGGDLDFYRNIPVCPMPYGQTLTMIALTEYLIADSIIKKPGKGKRL